MTIHETYTDANGVLTLANVDDSHYEQKFATATEFFEFVRQLAAAGNAHFGTTARLIDASDKVTAAPYLIPADTPPLDPQKHIPVDELAVKWFRREDDGSQIRQDYTWAEHQAANQQTLDEIAAFVGVKR